MKSKRDQADLEKYLDISHDNSELGYTLDTPLDVIFDSNATAALVPEVTIGPYWVAGELIRVSTIILHIKNPTPPYDIRIPRVTLLTLLLTD